MINPKNHIFLYGLVFSLLIFCNVFSRDREVYSEGLGRTREDAIAAAIRNGIDEFYGVSISSLSITQTNLEPENRMILVREAEGIRYKVTSVEFTDKYKIEYRAYIKLMIRTFHPSESAWRSALIPGWGQFYKGSSAKGWAALVGTSGLLVAGVLSANHSTEMDNRSNETLSQFKRNYYNDEATKYHQISMVCYGLAAGLYALNVFDAISSPLGFRTRMITEINYSDKTVQFNFVFCQSQTYGS